MTVISDEDETGGAAKNEEGKLKRRKDQDQEFIEETKGRYEVQKRVTDEE